jgi:hypothetical protein
MENKKTNWKTHAYFMYMWTLQGFEIFKDELDTLRLLAQFEPTFSLADDAGATTRTWVSYLTKN